MNYSKATKVWLSKNHKAQKTIKQISEWNEKATINGNAIAMKIHPAWAYTMKKKYDLKVVSSPKGPTNGTSNKTIIMRGIIQSLMSGPNKFTLEQIGESYGITRQRVHQLLKSK